MTAFYAPAVQPASNVRCVLLQAGRFATNNSSLRMPWRLGYTSRVIAAAVMLVAAFPCFASASRTERVVPVELSASSSPYAVFASAAYLDDPSGKYDIDDVARGSAGDALAPFPRSRLGDRIIKGWFRFAMRAPASEAGAWTLSAPAACDVFDIYYPRANGTYGVIHAGMLVPFADRGREVTYPSVALSPELTSGQPVYVYVVSNRVFRSRGLFTIFPTQQFSQANQSIYIRDVFFGGLFFAILVINLFLAFYLRDRAFVAYVIAMLMHVLTQFTQSTTAWKVFWPHLSVPYSIPAVVVETLFFVSLAMFWRIFLDLPRRRPVLDWILLGFVGVAALRTILLLVLPRQPEWLAVSDFPMVDCLAVTALAGAIDAARNGYRAARFLIVALVGLLLIWDTTFLIQVDLLPPIFGDITTGVYYGVAWDALFLTFALADRIETAKRGMIEAQGQALTAQTETVERLRERDTAVSRFLPRAFLEYLGRANVVDLQLGDHVESEMAILFSDIRSFTALSESMSPKQTFDFLNAYLRRAGPIIRGHDGFIDKYIGDALLGLFPKAAHSALDAAIDMQRGVLDYNRERARAGEPPIAIGVGLHRGMLMLGAIGESERIETTVIAEAVNIAARTESLTKQFRAPVIATASVIAALERTDDYKLRPLGEVIVYGASRGLNMFEVFDGDEPELLLSKVRTLDDFTAGVRAFTAGDFTTSTDAFARVLERSPNDRTAEYFLEQSRVLIAVVPSAPWDGRIRMDVK